MKFTLLPVFEVVCQIAHFEKARSRQHIIAEFCRRSHEQFRGDGKIHCAKRSSRPLRVAGGHDCVGAEIKNRLDRIRAVFKNGGENIVSRAVTGFSRWPERLSLASDS